MLRQKRLPSEGREGEWQGRDRDESQTSLNKIYYKALIWSHTNVLSIFKKSI